MANVNIRTIAKLAGVSIATVSRALKNPPEVNIDPNKLNRILEICAKLQYQPNEHTRRMFAGKANTIAILFPENCAFNENSDFNIADINFSSCIMGAQSILSRNSISLLLNELTPKYLEEKQYLKIIRGKAVDGILIWGALTNWSWLRELQNENIPVVMLQNFVDNINFNYVIANDYLGMSELVKKLIETGIKNIALVPAYENSSTAIARNNAVRDTANKYGLNLIESNITGYGYECGKRATNYLLSLNKEIDCIINSNDMAAWGCYDELISRCIKVPNDISVVGADGLRVPGAVQITSYLSPSKEIGKLGASKLLRMLNSEDVDNVTELEVTLIGGNTSLL